MKNNEITIDGKTIPFEAGQTIMEAAEAAGIYIPHICYHADFKANGSCKLCTCKINGSEASSCSTPASAGQVIENDTDDLNKQRRMLTQMLFVEGNHYCPSCMQSGDCELQAMAYHLGMTNLQFPLFNSQRNLDASHPDLMIDRNRCIYCELCIRASRTEDKKDIFCIAGRGENKSLLVTSDSGLLKDTDLELTDRAASICPVGCLIKKEGGFTKPIGERRFDQKMISNQAISTKLKDTPDIEPGTKVKVSTCSLAGCFGCHMSFLDIDERIVDLVEYVEFNRTPLTDIKHCDPDCDVGLVEGGVCNTENIEVLKHFRESCKILIAVGSCAINGGVPAVRNSIDVEECLREAYVEGIGLTNPQIPSDKEIPHILEKVHPIHEIVKVDYFLPGCPPPADAFWEILTGLLADEDVELSYNLMHFD